MFPRPFSWSTGKDDGSIRSRLPAPPEVTLGGGNALSSALFMPLLHTSGQLRPSALHSSSVNHLATCKVQSGRCLLLCNPRKTQLGRIIFSLETLIFHILFWSQEKPKHRTFFFLKKLFFFSRHARLQNLNLKLAITLFKISKKK